MERRIISIASLILTLALSSCSQPPHAQRLTLPDTLAFDDSLHRLYFYGHRVRSPLVLAYADGQLVINGFRAEPVVPDTTGMEALSAKLYGNVPYIRRRHSEGLTYVQANDEFNDRVHQSVRRALAEYKRAVQEGDSDPTSRARMVLDTEVIDVRSRFFIDGRYVELTQRGKGLEGFEGFGGSTRKPTPAEEEADHRRRALDQAQSVLYHLQGNSSSLTIISQTGLSMDAGGDALIKKRFAEIDEAIRTGHATDGQIPKNVLEEIIAKSAP